MPPERETLTIVKVDQDKQQRMFLWFVNGIILDAIGSDEMQHSSGNDSETIFSSVRSAKYLARNQIAIASQKKFSSLAQHGNSYYDSSFYNRLQQILGSDPERKINAIVNTSLYVMSKVLETIPRLAPTSSQDGLVQIANSSFQFTDTLSRNEDNNLDLAIFLLSGQHISQPGFNEELPWRIEDRLIIREGEVDFSDMVKQKFALRNPLAGGALNVGDGNDSVVSSYNSRLYSWFVDQVAPIYEQSRR